MSFKNTKERKEKIKIKYKNKLWSQKRKIELK
jgi:hypothetical protein